MSPYFARLRAALGHELILIPGVTVLVWDEASRLLLVRSDDGTWGLIGGAVEPDESPGDAAIRETAEEVGVRVDLTGLRAALGGKSYRLRYDNGDEVAYVQSVFDARIADGVPTPDFDEVTEARWFTSDELRGAELDDFALATLTSVDVLPETLR